MIQQPSNIMQYYYFLSICKPQSDCIMRTIYLECEVLGADKLRVAVFRSEEEKGSSYRERERRKVGLLDVIVVTEDDNL